MCLPLTFGRGGRGVRAFGEMMANILVSGLTNWETTVRIEGFPLEYNQVNYPFFGVNGTVSGVGYNVAKALTTLGDRAEFLSLVGHDALGRILLSEFQQHGIPTDGVVASLSHTPQSVILFDSTGRRQIHVDLKDIQESRYPEKEAEEAIAKCDLAALCNINFSRPLLSLAKAAGKTIASDVHVLDNLDDSYNQDFLQSADILFMSSERIPCSPEEWVKRVFDRFPVSIVGMGLGAEGALLAVRQDGFIGRFPAKDIRPIVNTIGAGDALFSCFIHSYAQNRDPYRAIQRAILFASYKIGANGGAEGFLSEAELTVMCP